MGILLTLNPLSKIIVQSVTRLFPLHSCIRAFDFRFHCSFLGSQLFFQHWLAVIGKKKIPLNRPSVSVVAHIVNPFQYKTPFPQPGNDLMGQGLPGIEFHKRAFHIHLGEPPQQVLAPPKRLQLEPLHIQFKQRRPGNLFGRYKIDQPPHLDRLCANLAELARHLGDNTAVRAICELALQHPASRPYNTMELFIELGHALVGLGLPQEAAEAYRRATALRKEYGSVFRIMASEAGLAQVYLAQGDCNQALAHVETILAYLADHPALEGSIDRYPVFMTCYQVLVAAEDPRAQEVLEAGYNLLMDRAAKIEDPTTRRSFLENVPVNREIVEIWERLQGAQAGAGG